MQELKKPSKVVAMCEHCNKVLEGNPWVFEKWKNCGECGERFIIIQQDYEENS